jgi:hypothetical protein
MKLLDANIRVMLCKECRNLQPHIFHYHGTFTNKERTEQWVEIDTVCIRKFRTGLCDTKTRRKLSIRNYNALVENRYL